MAARSIIQHPPPWATPGEWRFGVRAFGSVSLNEEENVDAAVLIIVDSTGADITHRPAAPFGLRLRKETGGRVVAEWSHPDGTRENVPTGFRLYAGWPTPDYHAPVPTTTNKAFHGSFSAVQEGLSDGPLIMGVRAFNAAVEETNAALVAVNVDGTPPDPVDGLDGLSFVSVRTFNAMAEEDNEVKHVKIVSPKKPARYSSGGPPLRRSARVTQGKQAKIHWMDQGLESRGSVSPQARRAHPLMASFRVKKTLPPTAERA